MSDKKMYFVISTQIFFQVLFFQQIVSKGYLFRRVQAGIKISTIQNEGQLLPRSRYLEKITKVTFSKL